MEIISIDKIELTRINDKFNRNFSLKSSYRKKKEYLRYLIASRHLGQLPSPYYLHISVGTHFDIDSFLKPLLDAMEEAKVIDNDKNILKLIVEKEVVKRNVDNWLIVNLYTWNEDQNYER